MLPFAVNAASLLGLAGSSYVAFRLSSRGSMHVHRLWIIPVATLAAAHGAHRAPELTAFGYTAMALGLAAGILLGWHEARTNLLSVDLCAGRLNMRRNKRAFATAIATGALGLLLTNLFPAEMLRLLNAFLLAGVGSACAHRLYLWLAWISASRKAARTSPAPMEARR